MADVLVDTSVWIDFFRNAKSSAGDVLDNLLSDDRVLVCGVVEMEVFQGLKDGSRAEIRALFESIPYVNTTREDFIAGGELWRNLRRKGVTIPSTDCLIATQCQRRKLTLFSLDAHFDAIEGLDRLR